MFFTIILTFAAIYLVFKLVNQHFKFKHIPQPFYQIPFIGGTIGSSIFIVKQKQFEIVDLHQKYGPVMLAGPLGIPTLMIADPVEIKRIHNDTKLFPRSEFLQKLFVGIFEFGLANIASGPLHKKHRKLLQPAFGPKHLRQIPDACVKVFQTAIEKWGSKGTLDFGTAMLNVTLDILGYVAFGNHIGAVEGKLESTELWTELENFLFNNVLPKRLMLPKYLWNFMGVGVDSPKVKFRMNQYDAFFDALIDSPETNSKLDNYNDDSKFELNFLERLVLSLREGKMTRKEVYDECLDFLVAGHETTSHTLAFLMWDLCLYPEFQEELYDMVKDIKDFNNQPAVELFDRVLKESQRLHTIVFAGISRITTQDTVMSGCHVPKDTLIRASYRSVHLNPMYYPSPLEFNPNRWLDPETLSQPFFPFAGGEHACIGQKLALIEIKTLMICLLQKYRFSMSKDAHEAVSVTTPLTLKCNPQIQYTSRH